MKELESWFFDEPDTQTVLPDSSLDWNGDFYDTWQVITGNEPLVFVTGAAGCGKSTMLRLFLNKHKNVVCAASTGIAAINVGGHTCHSLFRLPLTVCYKHFLSKADDSHFDQIREAEWLVLDEVSMNRADVIDGIDEVCQRARQSFLPFGGLKVRLFGDLFQLAPILNQDDKISWAEFNYASPYFFDAEVFKTRPFVTKILTKIYRQTDEDFIELLHRVRQGNPTYDDLATLNNRVLAPENDTVTLCPTNKQADEINQMRLDEIEAQEHTFSARVTNNFPESMFPVKKELKLKVGAQVLFRKNDYAGGDFNFANGDTGVIMRIGDDKFDGIKQKCVLVKLHRTNREVKVFSVTWERYEAVGGKKKLLGSFQQFPLMLGFANSIHKCVAGETLVSSAKGLLRIENLADGLREGEERAHSLDVLSRNGLAESDFVFNNGLQPCLKVTTRRGFSITGTAEHPLLARIARGEMIWKTIADLQAGDCLVMRKGALPTKDFRIPKLDFSSHSQARKVELPKKMSVDLAWLMGVLIGNGSVNDGKEYRIDMASMDEVLIERYCAVVKELFDILPRCPSRAGNKAKNVYFQSCYVRKFLLALGLSYSLAKTKEVPFSVLQSSADVQAAFLQGLFDTDGGVNNLIHHTTVSLKLAQQVQIMLCGLGVISSLRNLNSKIAYKAYRIQICGANAKKFVSKVGFFAPEKKKKSLELIAKTNPQIPKSQHGAFPDSLLISQRLYEELLQVSSRPYGKKQRLKLTEKKTKLNYLFSNLKLGNSRLNPEILAFIRDQTKANLKIFEDLGEFLDGCFLEEIESIESVGDQPVFDIQVPKEHSFIANGFVNHNSQGLSFDKMHLAETRMFAPSQFYVAASRVRSLEGLTLAKPVSKKNIWTDTRVSEFYAKEVF